MDEERTVPDEATQDEERSEAGSVHTADRPPTAEEDAAADTRAAAADGRERESVARHEKEMLETGAHVKGEGAID